MPSLKEVRNRIKSVQSTQQITKAMKMVAAAKLRKAQDATIQLRPYSKKLNEILANLSENSEEMADNNFTIVKEIQKVLIIVITSDRGLCGPFNTNVIKSVNALIGNKYSEQNRNNAITFLTIGKRGFEFFSKKSANIIDDYTNIYQKLSFDSVKTAAERAINDFEDAKFDVVHIVYNEFKNVATQILRNDQLLPIVALPVDISKKSVAVNYIFEPNASIILNSLVPKFLKLQVYKAVLESNAAEHGARMTAMDKATENAGEMLKELKISYNRSRQASITKEILEIVGGAEALSAN